MCVCPQVYVCVWISTEWLCVSVSLVAGPAVRSDLVRPSWLIPD